MSTYVKAKLLASSILVSCLAIAPVSAMAQEAQDGADNAIEAIVVTGSRINRPDLTTSSPVNVVGAEEIALRQPGNAEELLRDLPSVRPNLGSSVNNGGDGSASVDLRGIGTNRTLVILDGRRLVPFGLDGITDLNNIPLNMIERVDVVTGGASSVYGADAVAGVVNFITKRDFEGVRVSAGYKVTGEGDGATYTGDALIGVNSADGKGNVTLSFGYTKRESVLQTDRAIGAFPINSANGLFGGSPATAPVLFTSPSTIALGLGANPEAAGAILDPSTGQLRLGRQSDYFNSTVDAFFQTPLERYNVYASGHYELAPGLEAYGSGMFTRNKTLIQLSASGTFNNVFQLPLSNGYLPTGVRNQLCNAISLSAAQCAAAAAATTPTSAGYREVPIVGQRRFVEYGPRKSFFDVTQFQVVGGLRGNVTSDIKFDVSAQYGETNQDQFRENGGSASRLQQALRSYNNAAGTPVCVDPSNGCVPFNLFGPVGSITPAMLNYIDLDALIRRKVSLAVVTGNVAGDLFGLTSPLSTKPAAFSLGAEWRELKAISRPDASMQIQNEVLGTGARTPPDSGQITAKELFGELILPLVEDKPFVQSLQLEAGFRYSDYDTTGASTTWKVGGDYQPVDGFRFRGMVQRAVRSPNIAELFASPVQALGNLGTDPCQGALPVGNAGLSALCIATGAPAATIGGIPAPASSQTNQTTSGNRNLDVERASTYTLGAVLTPAFLPGFSATIDYFNIKVKDAISTPAVGDILNGCYSSALNPAYAYNAFCQLVGRNPLTGSLNGAGETLGVVLAGSNLGKIETAGVDLGVNYRFGLDRWFDGDPGQIRLGLNGTWLDYYHFQATPNAINRDCTGYYSTNCTNPRPELKWNGRVTWERGALGVSMLWNHIGSVELEPYRSSVTTPLSTPQPGGPNPAATTFVNGVAQNGVLEAFRKIKAYDYFDLSARYALGDIDLTVTVENLFDRKPPLVGSNVGGTTFNNPNTFPTIYDTLGRSFTFGVAAKF